MIRAITQDDSAAVISLAVTSGLFPAEETAILEKMLADYFGGKRDEGHRCVIAEVDEPLGVAYYEPATATDRTWYLTMIAVHGERQGQGIGAALMRYMEDDLRAAGQRVVLVETSALPEFMLTRQFYLKCGYEQEARVRDYFADGDDMVLFRKALG